MQGLQLFSVSSLGQREIAHIAHMGIMSREVVVWPTNDIKLPGVKKTEKPVIFSNSFQDNLRFSVKLLIFTALCASGCNCSLNERGFYEIHKRA